MNHCEHCLACDLLGEGSAAGLDIIFGPHAATPEELPLPFAQFVVALTGITRTDNTPVSGAKLVVALDKLIAGYDPTEAAREALA